MDNQAKIGTTICKHGVPTDDRCIICDDQNPDYSTLPSLFFNDYYRKKPWRLGENLPSAFPVSLCKTEDFTVEFVSIDKVAELVEKKDRQLSQFNQIVLDLKEEIERLNKCLEASKDNASFWANQAGGL